MSLKKEPWLSLGITIAGGRDCRSRLPVYITSVQPVGCLHRDGTIKRGANHRNKKSVLVFVTLSWPRATARNYFNI